MHMNLTVPHVEITPEYLGSPISAIALTINLISATGLGGLLATIALSSQVMRHPLYVNLLISSLLFATLKSYNGLVLIAWMFTTHQRSPKQESSSLFNMYESTAENIIWTSMHLSTFVLVFYLNHIFKASSTEGVVSDRKAKENRWIGLLLLVPYLGSIFLLIGLIRSVDGRVATSIIELFIIVITLVLDVILLYAFTKRRRIFKRISIGLEVPNIISLELLLKLLAFCVYRMIFIIMDIISYPYPTFVLLTAIETARSAYPLIAFLIFGPFCKDIRKVWFMTKLPEESDDEPTECAEEGIEIRDSRNETGYGLSAVSITWQEDAKGGPSREPNRI
ncbi:hypothetical protein M422DRAFT_266843 [Sphaerobolus stellatus SS14]|uniref:Unplaced genomic scaffold SPHSTscaffold_167, whole genome shotgun sequence n=1 Tax=Sphaerobolus stellatus (strain SS14) TaxID=990650 RepID=A0A0C9V1X6_SPHS4|nr:hypothetical protein M422DRAFT_266843 [Sphaerobolus stellatus SS14]